MDLMDFSENFKKRLIFHFQNDWFSWPVLTFEKHPQGLNLDIFTLPGHYQEIKVKDLQQWALKCDHFWFIHIFSYTFNPIRSQLETVLDFWLVNVCMKECELIKGGRIFGLLAVTRFAPDRKKIINLVAKYMYCYIGSWAIAMHLSLLWFQLR